jgi:hypothetical protein
MSELSLADSFLRAQARLRDSARRPRSDRGRSRLSPQVESKLVELLESGDRPAVVDVLRQLGAFCRRRGLQMPSRATVYNAMHRVPMPVYDFDELPGSVRQTLHNVARGKIPGQQVVFAAFNFGDVRAISFASGLPWICLHRASTIPGFRPKSFALLSAVMAYRGI